VEWEDGDQSSSTIRKMTRQKMELQPECAVPPPGVELAVRPLRVGVSPISAVALCSGPVPTSGVPITWDLGTAQGVQTALESLLHTGCTRGYVTRLAGLYQAWCAARQQAILNVQDRQVPTTEGEVLVLLGAVDFSCCEAVWDPFVGHGKYRRSIQQQRG